MCTKVVRIIKAFNVRLSDKLHKAMKFYLLEHDLSAQEFIVSLIKKEIQYNDLDDKIDKEDSDNSLQK